MLKWSKRILISVVGLFVLALLIGMGFEQWSRHVANGAYPAPGNLYNVEGRQAHIQCSGVGSPTIILEAGLDAAGSQSWASIFEDLSIVSRVCAYDRAGIMWSESSDLPRTSENIANELHALLSIANEQPPYVFVGHSLGGIFIRVYDQLFPNEVEGFVFVDSSHPEQMERLPPESSSELPSTLLMSAMVNSGLMRLTSNSNWLSVLPKKSAEAVAAHFPASIIGVVDEIDVMDTILDQAKQTGNLGKKPVVVLSAGKLPNDFYPEFTESVITEMKEGMLELHSELAELSSNSDHRVVRDAMHYIHWDKPDAVKQAIGDIVEAVRQNSRVTSRGNTKPKVLTD